MKAKATRRKRLSPELRTRIVQIRASNEERPPSLDAILVQLSLEPWDPLPSRGSVQNVVRQWEDMDPDTRIRDVPFQWHLPERAGIPMEALACVLECQRAIDRVHISEGLKAVKLGSDVARVMARLGPFTNRQARWCWMVHQADPKIAPTTVLSFALWYSRAAQLQDLIPQAHQFDMRWLDAILRFQPYKAASNLKAYMQALRLRMIPFIPTEKAMRSEYASEKLLVGMPGESERQVDYSLMFHGSLLVWLHKRFEAVGGKVSITAEDLDEDEDSLRARILGP